MSLVLVTGGAGFIGSHTADRLISLGYQVRILDNLQKPVHLKGKPDYLNPKAEFMLGDVRDKETMIRALDGVEYVFHFAAYQDYLPDFSTFFQVNSVSTALIYEIAVEKNLPLKKVVVASSQFVQGEGLYKKKDGSLVAPYQRPLAQLEVGDWEWRDQAGRPMEWQWTPESHASPPNAYAISKYSQELMTLAFGRRYQIPSVALRYSIVQGSRQSFYNAYSGACRIFNLHYFFNKAPTIYEDGLQRRDFVNIHDVVDANLLVMQDPRADYNAYCIGGGHPYTVREFADIVAKVHGKEHLKPNIPGEFRLGDTRHTCSDIAKIKKLGWSPRRTAEDSVKDYLEYLKAQTDIEDILEYAEKTMKQLNVVRMARK
ncbi:MAG: epimerase [Candidatus Edwardsbacteria bacterium RIFOXYD12_FULL_50_11]|uniref:Epimerase n=1 Tax=Candidatus Edwardsbacteria bacterium GWF2_54_11 TaxID=1817851 RepID=A0A1F5R153_9BACT|nr:MAG: epimerase [Candidatus Edwardsbacteria bacterium RifOxyC12_full_54_24]OGF07878.1 MAG: epimerase [Candidatus Edwardsbacteria bacterium RifOxyA12_full_54_48]OGF08150.1 MAG: epimerase [Candidatus Edwardsbacteria bacterium GWF2_54_11]OGF10127.1 MAG: epimerase [Candidatus Edwardsbacteria bacterium GWE2_54_12]OGF15038.1 MAG: epimerase [Candidatus Edwardsbacteria bacterium RIFOXYD12_FULL_50_11]OGJ19182.1 MAG: epimerase [Candidatus Edwardsbacteria bacterium RifOxyB12_full_52_30]HAD82252.1 epim